MSKSKYVTIAEGPDGIEVMKGKKKVNFSLIHMNSKDEDGPLMNEREYERVALLHLPKQMGSDEFKEFTEGKNINQLFHDCIGIDNDDA